MSHHTKRFRYEGEGEFRLKDHPTRVDALYKSQGDYEEILKANTEEIGKLQEKHYAADLYALLIIFQAMDTAGKDGMISHVMSGLNPQGCNVYSFKQPSPQELKHDFLWRSNACLPERGKIGIFNRSYYEDVLVVRVHPELLNASCLPPECCNPKSIWDDRYKSIDGFEKHLQRNGTRIVKFFLHLSKHEQLKRLLARIEHPDKNWKFSVGDVHEREFWDDYQHAYEQAIAATATKHCPWYVIPADDKENARIIVSQILVDTMQSLHLEYPKSTPEHLKELKEIEAKLRKQV